MQENPNATHLDPEQQETAAAAAPAQQVQEEELGLPNLSDEAVARIDALEQELAALKDQYLRAVAEQENLRRRAQEDVAAAHKYAISKFLQEVLPVKDSLEMALMDQSGQFDNLKFGVDLTLKQLASALEKAQVRELNPLGEKLDPHHHQAMSMEESDAEPGTVVRVMQKGYLVADRVLRPAMVVVAKARG
ncbi:nucleotide exchange factor GrpE [Crenobacter caeni]|uniref:Protein GrpE n=1 Tax=Crenobacter caeni TaxID=2705474 RepID=A0A6B2KV82_9NEIS|nr:nucleotide exchange factor GrpE [Crenobacter caeni]NDV14152.1 nucleotide exchange factor GrpE [Crenobacter caeni]